MHCGCREEAVMQQEEKDKQQLLRALKELSERLERGTLDPIPDRHKPALRVIRGGKAIGIAALPFLAVARGVRDHWPAATGTAAAVILTAGVISYDAMQEPDGPPAAVPTITQPAAVPPSAPLDLPSSTPVAQASPSGTRTPAPAQTASPPVRADPTRRAQATSSATPSAATAVTTSPPEAPPPSHTHPADPAAQSDPDPIDIEPPTPTATPSEPSDSSQSSDPPSSPTRTRTCIRVGSILRICLGGPARSEESGD